MSETKLDDDLNNMVTQVIFHLSLKHLLTLPYSIFLIF